MEFLRSGQEFHNYIHSDFYNIFPRDLLEYQKKLLRSYLYNPKLKKKKYEGNKNIIEVFDDLMEKYNKAENEEQREIYKEEQNKINEWNTKIEQQNEDLNNILIRNIWNT